jgi:hypothetical protein
MRLAVLCVPVLICGRWMSFRMLGVGTDGIDSSK